MARPAPAGDTCPTCFEAIESNQVFCDNCGTRLSDNLLLTEIEQPVPDITCPSCGTSAPPDSTFCDNCGTRLAEAVLETYIEEPIMEEPSGIDTAIGLTGQKTVIEPALPRLHVVATHKDLLFPAGKDQFLIGRNDPIRGYYPDFDLTPHGGEQGGVSRRHARIWRDGANYHLEDLNAVNYTFINRRKIAPYAKHLLNSGDELRFGRVVLNFYVG